MTLPKLPHELIKGLLDAMTFSVSYDSVTVNMDGTWTLVNVCEFHYIQIGRVVTIAGNEFRVKDYDYTAKTITLESYNNSAWNVYQVDGDGNYVLTGGGERIIVGTDDYTTLSFDLYRPLFVHGTPVKQEGELKQEDRIDRKTPMVYLMEPYRTVNDYSYDSAIAYRSDITLCFLTECDTANWTTDQHYQRAIAPMRILMEEVTQAILSSPLFYIEEQMSSPAFYANFGINIKECGQKKLLFAENLSGCSDDIKLQVYSVDECEC